MSQRAIAFAPGRVNLIGEHTDYNQGLALPFAIAEGVRVEAELRDDDRVTVTARDLEAEDSFRLAAPDRVPGWRAFARGLAAELQEAGARLRRPASGSPAPCPADPAFRPQRRSRSRWRWRCSP